MQLRLNCSCGKVLKVDEEYKGKQGRCPKCSTIIDIPEDIEAVPALKDTYTGRKVYNPQELFESVIDSVVGIFCETGSGSGVFVDSNGLVATNRHVVGRNTNVTVRLNDGTEYPADVIRSFKDIDLAFAKVDLKRAKCAELSKTHKIKVGQSVFAIGHPMGLQNTLTRGIVSAVARLIKGKRYVQTDAPINPGNSGGPLFNEYAEIVGITTMGIRESQGLGFAIPVDVVMERYEEVKEDLETILEQSYCGVCGKNSHEKKYCEHCGAELRRSSTVEKKSTKPIKQKTKAELTNCPSCKASLEAVETYCPKCGTTLLILVNMGLFGTKKVAETTVKDCVGIVENFLRKAGLNPDNQRLSDNDSLGWVVSRGSALIYILLNNRDNMHSLRIVSPIVYLPEANILPFYRKCLELNMGLFNCSLAASEDTIYVVHERPIAGLDTKEFEGTLGFLSAVADDLDNKFADEFGAKIFSEQME